MKISLPHSPDTHFTKPSPAVADLLSLLLPSFPRGIVTLVSSFISYCLLQKFMSKCIIVDSVSRRHILIDNQAKSERKRLSFSPFSNLNVGAQNNVLLILIVLFMIPGKCVETASGPEKTTTPPPPPPHHTVPKILSAQCSSRPCLPLTSW